MKQRKKTENEKKKNLLSPQKIIEGLRQNSNVLWGFNVWLSKMYGKNSIKPRIGTGMQK